MTSSYIYRKKVTFLILTIEFNSVLVTKAVNAFQVLILRAEVNDKHPTFYSKHRPTVGPLSFLFNFFSTDDEICLVTKKVVTNFIKIPSPKIKKKENSNEESFEDAK